MTARNAIRRARRDRKRPPSHGVVDIFSCDWGHTGSLYHSDAPPLTSSRRFPPSWSVEELNACFVVKDSSGQKLEYVYYEDELDYRVVVPVDGSSTLAAIPAIRSTAEI